MKQSPTSRWLVSSTCHSVQVLQNVPIVSVPNRCRQIAVISLCSAFFHFFHEITAEVGFDPTDKCFLFCKNSFCFSAFTAVASVPVLRRLFFSFLSHFLVSIIHMEASSSAEHLDESRPNSFPPPSLCFPAPSRRGFLLGGNELKKKKWSMWSPSLRFPPLPYLRWTLPDNLNSSFNSETWIMATLLLLSPL